MTTRITRKTRRRKHQSGQHIPGGRSGFVLPFVLVATLLVAMLAAAAQFAAWRATRSARQAFNGERALLGADESIASTVANWNAEAFARSAIGSRTATRLSTAAGDVADVTIARTAPLVVWVDAAATSQTFGAPSRAQRRVGRALFVQPPPLPLSAALVALSPVHLQGTMRVSGIDDATVGDECGPWRDTASIAGVYGRTRLIDTTTTIAGAPRVSTAVDTARDLAAFNAAWLLIAARASPRPAPANASLPGEPSWRAVVVRDTGAILLAGTSRHEGLLAVDGDLVLHGTLSVRGLLIVRGAVDATAGQLDVEGAVVLFAPSGGQSRFGTGTNVRYAQCALRRALAAVSRPTALPFRTWSERE